MAVVRFPAFRRFDALRISTNDAMVALLIGSRLAESDLASKHARQGSAASQRYLPELFPGVSGIERLNRTAHDASRLLGEAERHLVYMAIPFTLTVYGTLLVEALRMLEEDGHMLATKIKDPSQIHLVDVHDVFTSSSKASLPSREVDLFDFARQIRNRIVHYAGTSGSRLHSSYRQLPKATREEWERLAGRTFPRTDASGSLDLAAGELVAVLGVTKHLADEINLALARTLSREYWARLLVEDFAQSSPQRFRDSSGLRRLRGFARTYYSELGFAGDDLEVAYEAALLK